MWMFECDGGWRIPGERVVLLIGSKGNLIQGAKQRNRLNDWLDLDFVERIFV